MIEFIVLIVVLICLAIICLILTLQVNVKLVCPKIELQILVYASLIAIVGIIILLDLSNIIRLCQ